MIPQQPAERRTLIGEYVLGLLDEAESAEVRQLLEDDEDAARMALEWERHFLELSDQLPAHTPSAVLWPRIQRNLGLGPAAAVVQEQTWQTWWNNLGAWRLTSAALAIALVVALLPGVWRPGIEPNSYTVVLQAPGEAAKPGWVVHVDSQGALRLEPLLQDQIPADRSVQFWTLVDPAIGPRSLGLVEPGRDLALTPEQIGAVQAGQLFELTLEPVGGSPINRPTGKVLYIGRAVLASAN
ncbi:anti-sigma factor [Pseudomonas sp. UBA2684]|uniref:anti-sigma factor n=1 Tax=Pseudomonas sp. UBA2684 TaxID=1947311 RepID=UPI000E9AF55D|nr:anti-sigma factor [Pseudomonas sp. UBA2684]HBX54704.1 anti-sigma factor [Pseudomonas sp.]|tara:strand:+ start:4030 stop:4749 length:720 start_codon:yes stop_codon:yes gene_type:complete